MFQRIIVGVDGAEGGQDAISLACRLVARGGRVSLVNVYQESQSPVRGSAGIWGDDLHRRSLELLRQARAAGELEAELIPEPKAELIPVTAASVGRGLHELAERVNADLLVVGSSHRGVVGRVLFSDDVRSALNCAPCAVGVAPRGYADQHARIGEVGVGYDESPESREALRVARQLAAPHRARVSALRALPLTAEIVQDMKRSDAELPDELDRVRDRLAALQGVEPHVVYGDPGRELVLFSASVDLLVLGSRGYGPLGRMLHGRMALHLARSAHCPVLVTTRVARVLEASETLFSGQPVAAS